MIKRLRRGVIAQSHLRAMFEPLFLGRCAMQCLGKLGKVTKVYTDGDLRVNVDGQTWTFNPLCVVPVPGSATEISNTMTANTREEHASQWTHPLAVLICDV